MGEARNAGRLHHPNIVGVFDFVDEGATCWIIMEYVPSRSLAQIVTESGPLTPEEAGSIGCQIAAALAKSHSEGVVHGDVTPENILVTDEGVARLTDFGISRALWSDAPTARRARCAANPGTWRPRWPRGSPRGEKSDVFSLGASLFAAVEGRSPYGEAEHLMAYLARAVEGHIEPAHRAGPLDAPLTALLEVEPRRRPDAARAQQAADARRAPAPAHTGAVARQPYGDLASRTLRLPRLLRRPGTSRPSCSSRHGPYADGAALWRSRRWRWSRWARSRPGSSSSARGPRSDERRQGRPYRRADAKPSATAQAGAIGDERTADPCGLLGAASLSRFGGTELDPDYGEIDRCDVLVRNNSGDDNRGRRGEPRLGPGRVRRRRVHPAGRQPHGRDAQA